ncbi:DUF202 domain-containing protein [Microbacterium sp. UFMG61]|uniref:DUF202 domain-containing protein n=1 Tax=Microbacterium sp. UFMG61 TaxID=2745935 RepID=UPI00189098D4|nr:DUF202 domain-containing protein [Microbacterium sp. UFMG61]
MSLFDPGLQPERTELAWRRTALSLSVGSLIALRILPQALDSVFGILPGLLGLAGAAFLWFTARRRYRRVNAVLLGDSDRSLLPDGTALALTALSTTLLGVAGVTVALLRAIS